MLPRGVVDRIQANVNKPSFWKSLSPGEIWKSKSMRIIPEEFVRSTPGAFDHRVVFSVRWGNSWQLWLERENKDLFMIEEDWDMFVDDNHLGPNDNLFFRHDDTMFLEVQIFKSNGNEIMDVPLEVEPEPEPLHPKHQDSHKETTTATASVEFSRNGRARQGCADVKNPERYLRNPANPYFVKTVTKRNDALYVPKKVIKGYDLKFGPPNSPMSYHLPDDKKMEGLNKLYPGGGGPAPCFSGWMTLCRTYNLKTGDSVVCELERSGGLVTAVRVHFVNQMQLEKDYEYYLADTWQSVSRTPDPGPNSVVEKHVDVVETPPARDSTMVLPFAKKLLKCWEVLESMEVFNAMPQHPHFSPLLESEEEFREGEAIGEMVKFSELFEKVNNLQVDAPINSINRIHECFLKLEKHGFNVTIPRSRIAKLLSIKESKTRALDELKAVEEKITENDNKRRKCEEDIVELQRQEVLMKEAKVTLDKELPLMHSHAAVLDQKVQNVDQQFRAIVAAPWK